MSIFNIGLIGLMAQNGAIQDGIPYYTAVIIGALISVCVSYFLGSISSAIFLSKLLYKEDIRSYGSGNAGLTNMLRTYGKGAAALTLVGDMSKTALAIVFTGLIFGFSYTNGISLSGFCYLSGLCAVLGHVYPIYYGFKGGKGVLVTATMALILTPPVFAALITVFIIIVAISGYVSLGSICVASLFPPAVCLYCHFFGGSIPTLTVISTVFLGIFIVWCHRANIKRLLSGNEKKLSIGKKEK